MNALGHAALLAPALHGLALIALLAALTWVASIVRRDASLVDRMWPVFIAGAAYTYHAGLPAGGARALGLLVLVSAWALRLGAYLTHRNWGHGEDRRYQRIRARHEPNFAFKSLYLIFALQAVVAWILSWPLLLGLARAATPGWTDAVGAVIAAFGLAFEAIGDAQLARFKSDPAHAGQVMDRGLWRWTRHPNYFGEACFWWGLWLVGAGSAGLGGAWTLVSPILLTWLLLQVSGVRLLEQDLGERRPAYRDYIARTSAF
ncbi:MAG: DUF1295 domain-containing protein, partial [Burkholderiales bacterium]|nr:DUF1295 domain-containing protein [Burkholderiales bacterium]